MMKWIVFVQDSSRLSSRKVEKMELLTSEHCEPGRKCVAKETILALIDVYRGFNGFHKGVINSSVSKDP